MILSLRPISNVCSKMLNTYLTKHRLFNSETYFQNLSNEKNNSKIPLKKVKPPNILLYAPGHGTDINKQVVLLEQCLAPSRYTVYPISSNGLKSDPWMENAEAIIVWASDSVLSQSSKLNATKAIVKDFMLLGGKILSFSHQLFDEAMIQNVGDDKSDVTNYHCKFGNTTGKVHEAILPVHTWSGNVLGDDKTYCSLVEIVISNTAHCVACHPNKSSSSIITTLQLLATAPTQHDKASTQKVLLYLLHCMGLDTTWNSVLNNFDDSTKQLNKAYLFATNEKLQMDFFQRLSLDTSSNSPLTVAGLKFVPASEAVAHDDTGQVVVVYDNPPRSLDGAKLFPDSCSFDREVYFNSLTSKNYGQLVIYADVITSTMNVFDGICVKLTDTLGPIAIARQQTQGKGRSSNKWLSPVGCAMFTLVVHIPLQSRLGNALPFLQHITSVAVVHGIRTLPGLQDVNFTVKWPNDIYYGSTTKLGGVIVKSTIFRDTCIASIGCGINISNKKPTVCANDILNDEYSNDRTLQCEEVIARTVSLIEELIEDFQANGPDSFLELYYKYWIHSHTDVGVQIGGSTIQCLIVGVDDCGFLRARRHDNGHVIVLHPDGNSFDITKNLIVAKKTS